MRAIVNTRVAAGALAVALVAGGCTAPERAADPQVPSPPPTSSAESTPKEALAADSLRRPRLVEVDEGGRDRPTVVRADATLSFEIVRARLGRLTEIGVGQVMLAETIDAGLAGPLDISMPAPDEVERLARRDTASAVLDVEPGGRLRLGTDLVDVRPAVAKAQLDEARGSDAHPAATIRVVPGSSFGDVTNAVRLLRASGFGRVELFGLGGGAFVRDWPDAKCPFPPEARRVRITNAIAIVRVVIAPTGAPAEPIVVQDPGYGLGAMAASCVMRTTFEPGKDAAGKSIGEPVYFRVRFSVR